MERNVSAIIQRKIIAINANDFNALILIAFEAEREGINSISTFHCYLKAILVDALMILIICKISG